MPPQIKHDLNRSGWETTDFPSVCENCLPENPEYFAQNNERAIEDGVGLEEYDKQDEKGRELLRKLANSEPYYKKQRRLDANGQQNQSSSPKANATEPRRSIGPVRTSDNKSVRGRGGARGSRVFPGTAQLPPQPLDWEPPRDRNITSLFVTGIEDDLPEHTLRTFFTPFGVLRSIVCSHRSHCAFINYATREGAEAGADHCRGRAVIQGVPLRVTWGKPKALDHLDTEERMAYAKSGRETAKAIAAAESSIATAGDSIEGAPNRESLEGLAAIAAPPGQGEVQYASLAGN